MLINNEYWIIHNWIIGEADQLHIPNSKFHIICWLISFALIAHWCISTWFSKLKHESTNLWGRDICVNQMGACSQKGSEKYTTRLWRSRSCLSIFFRPLQLPSRGESYKTPPYSPQEGRDISRKYLSAYDSSPHEGRMGRVFWGRLGRVFWKKRRHITVPPKYFA